MNLPSLLSRSLGHAAAVRPRGRAGCASTPGREGAPAIALRGIELTLGGTPALRGLDLVVEAGERVVVFGPSGSGKSSLIRCVVGLETPRSGTIEIFGRDIGRSARDLQAARRRIGMIFQAFNLYSMRTVLENVVLAPMRILGLPRREAEACARECLARVGVAELADKYPFQISGGQQQRVAIARALVMQPRILVLDEPTSALDPELVQSVLALIQELAAHDITILCVTHELAFARRLADRAVFLCEGRILEEGSPDRLFGAPQTDRLRSFLGHLRH